MAKKEDIQGFKTYLQGKWIDITKATSQDAMDYKASLNPAPTQANLEAKIKTWNFTSKEALNYNRMTWDKQWAREVALWSQDATTWLDSIKTTVTPDEIAYMKSQWNNKINKSNITLDTTWLTPQEVVSEKKQALETPVTPKPVETKIEKPTTTTDITYSEDKNAYSPDKVISKAEQFIWADWKTYQTVRNSDNTLTTIDVTTWQPVTSKYTDAERDSIKQGFLKSPEQVQADQQKQVMNDPNVIYEQLKTGAFISKEVQNIPEYKKAYQRKQNLDRFSWMSTTDLATSIESGAFLPWTQVYDDLKLQNPKLVADAEAQNSINSINKPKTDVVDIQTKITDYLTKLMSDDEKVSYKETLSWNKEIIELNKTLAESWNKLAEYKDQLEYLEEDIKKDLEWRSVTKGYKNFIMWERNREISRLYNQELSKYNTIAWQIQTISEWIKYDMEEARKQEQDRMQNIQTAVWMYQTMTADQRALDLNQNKLEQEYAYSYWDINSANPTLQNIAIERAVADLYTKYPLPWMESQATKVAKVQNLMSQWMTWSQAITQLESEIRNSDRYKQYITPKVTQTQDWSKLDDKTLYNQKTWEFKTITASQSNAIDKQVWDKWWECWTFARQYTWISWSLDNIVWKTITDRKKSFTEWKPLEWWLVLFDKWYDSTYWHIAVVTKVNQDWTINIKESNLHWDWKITERFNLNPTTKSWIWGYYNNTPLVNWWKEDTNIISYNSATPTQLAKVIQTSEWKAVINAKNKVMKDPNASIEDILKYSQWWARINQTSEQQLGKFKQAIDQVWSLKENINNIDTWPILWILRSANPYDTKAQEIKAQLSSLIPNLARWVYWEVWVLTDNDIAIYSKTVPNLKSTQDVNNAILSMTFTAIANWYKTKLQSLASAKYDVSWYEWIYKEIKWQANKYLWTTWTTQWNTKTDIKSRIEQIRNSKNNW